MRKKGRYIRKVDRKKFSTASVIALLTFITGAAFFAVGMYFTVYTGLADASVIAVLGWIAMLLFIMGIVVEILGLRINKRLLLFDKWGLALNSVMFAAVMGIYIWGCVL